MRSTNRGSSGALIVAVVGGLLLGALTSVANAVVGLDSVDEQEYIDLGDQFGAVGRITGEQSYGHRGWRTPSVSSISGSGTLIAPDVVLIAAHLISNTSSLEFTLGDTTYEVTEWTTFPQWYGGNKPGRYGNYGKYGSDAALIRLNEEVTGIDPAVLFTGPDLGG